MIIELPLPEPEPLCGSMDSDFLLSCSGVMVTKRERSPFTVTNVEGCSHRHTCVLYFLSKQSHFIKILTNNFTFTQTYFNNLCVCLPCGFHFSTIFPTRLSGFLHPNRKKEKYKSSQHCHLVMHIIFSYMIKQDYERKTTKNT